MIPRIFIQSPLYEGSYVSLSDQQAHYLRNVLRLERGSTILLFNGTDGEWSASIEDQSKKNTLLICNTHTRPQNTIQPLKLICSLIKPQRMEWLIEKATELGVTHIQPVITDHCHIRKTNLDRLKAYAIEASEQSERLCVPIIHDIANLRDALQNTAEEILFADESRDQQARLKDILATKKINSILIGPEGGFSNIEKTYLYSRDNVHSVHLGNNILRAETAGLAIIAAVQTITGSWSI